MTESPSPESADDSADDSSGEGSGESSGRVVLVTGGGRGIGLACTRWFLDRGDRVAVASRSDTIDVEDGLERERVLALTCDVTDPDQVEKAFGAIEERWGPVEVLIANAGVNRDTLVLRMTDDAWSEVIDTDLTGVFRVAKRALAKMVRLHRGRIVLVSSVGAFIGSPGQANYAAAKAGLVGMARSMAREVASRSITVNVIAPGLVETNMLAALGDDHLQTLQAQVPLGRVAKPGEIAEAIGFLSSEGAAYVTGAVLAVDGGLSMGL